MLTSDYRVITGFFFMFFFVFSKLSVMKSWLLQRGKKKLCKTELNCSWLKMSQLSCCQWAQQCWQTIGSDVVMWHFRHRPKTGEERIWRKGTLSHKTESRPCVLHTLTDFCWQHRAATRTWFWAHYFQYLVTSIRTDDNIYWQWYCFNLWLFKFNI